MEIKKILNAKLKYKNIFVQALENEVLNPKLIKRSNIILLVLFLSEIIN